MFCFGEAIEWLGIKMYLLSLPESFPMNYTSHQNLGLIKTKPNQTQPNKSYTLISCSCPMLLPYPQSSPSVPL